MALQAGQPLLVPAQLQMRRRLRVSKFLIYKWLCRVGSHDRIGRGSPLCAGSADVGTCKWGPPKEIALQGWQP